MISVILPSDFRKRSQLVFDSASTSRLCPAKAIGTSNIPRHLRGPCWPLGMGITSVSKV